MPLQKAKFQRLNSNFGVDKELLVQFNPTEFTLNKSAQIAEIAVPGLDMPILQFVRGQTETLTLDLFFDSTEAGMGESVMPVTFYTDDFYQLIKINPETHAPPICAFDWGGFGFPGSTMTEQWSTQDRTQFQCIVESVRQRYTLFSPNGDPLRATLTVTLREYKTLEQQIDQIRFQSPDHTRTRVVQRGDTLSRIAGDAYGDAAQWRGIADHNAIDDPLDLRPGAILEIPPLR
jgi:hypothetical protein